jgi:hypothetical protein
MMQECRRLFAACYCSVGKERTSHILLTANPVDNQWVIESGDDIAGVVATYITLHLVITRF